MRRAAWIAGSVALALAGCGSSGEDRQRDRGDVTVREVEIDEPPVPSTPTRAEVRVIRGWADALRAGRVEQAARYFAIPAVVLDGTNPQRTLPNRTAVRSFNRRLPCGAELVGTERGEGAYVIATFRLTERPGPGSCADGVGHLAATLFLVKRGHIVQWLRAPDPVQPDDDAS
jgi:hypothetical protein